MTCCWMRHEVHSPAVIGRGIVSLLRVNRALAGTSDFQADEGWRVEWQREYGVQKCCRWFLIIVLIDSRDRSPCGCEIRPSPKRTMQPRVTDLASTVSPTDHGMLNRQGALRAKSRTMKSCLPRCNEKNDLGLLAMCHMEDSPSTDLGAYDTASSLWRI